jgi:hypothetical protein
MDASWQLPLKGVARDRIGAFSEREREKERRGSECGNI